MPLPPPPYGFASIPHVGSETDGIAPRELAESLARGEGYLGSVRNGWQEALGVHTTSGAPEQLIVLPQPTYLPLVTALVTAAAVLAMLFKFYAVSLFAVLVVAVLFVFAAQRSGHARDYGPLPVGRGVSVPPHTEVASTPPWLALICTLVADGTLFASLVFGTFYVWIATPNAAQAIAVPAPDLLPALALVAALALAAVAARASLRTNASGGKPWGWIGMSMLGLLAAIASAVALIAGIQPHPSEHAIGATAAALLGYVIFHAGVGLFFLASNVLRIRAGYVSPLRTLDLRLSRLWIDYTAVTAAIAVGLVLALPKLASVLGAQT